MGKATSLLVNERLFYQFEIYILFLNVLKICSATYICKHPGK